MVEKSEIVENENKKTWGFGVTGAPIWLCKELSKEAKKYYNDVYWPVIVDWYRKAKEYENIMRGGLPPQLEEKEEIEVPKEEEKKVKLFGQNEGDE